MSRKIHDSWSDGEVRRHPHDVEIDTWGYPQMGGYASKTTIVFETRTDRMDGGPGCFDAYVWHNGEWPFQPDASPRRGRVQGKCEACEHPYDYVEGPSVLHHCAADQFIDFGLIVLEYQAQHQEGVVVSEDRIRAAIARLQALLIAGDRKATEGVP